MKIVYKDLETLRVEVTKLVYESEYIIFWGHIKSSHPEIEEIDVVNALLYGRYAFDKKIEGRCVSWTKLTPARRLIRVVFEVHKLNGRKVVVITAFEEE